MNARTFARIAPLSGLLSVVLLVLGGYVLESRSVDDDAGAVHFRQYFEDETYSIFVGTTIFWFGLAALMWFLSCLRDRFVRDEEGTHSASSLAFAAGIGMVLLMFGATAPTFSGAIHANDEGRVLSAAAAETLFTLGDGFVTAAEFSWLVFMTATAVLILRHGALPRWIGWLSIALAVVLAVPPIGWAALLFASPIWIAIVSLLLYLRARAELWTDTANPLEPPARI